MSSHLVRDATGAEKGGFPGQGQHVPVEGEGGTVYEGHSQLGDVNLL